jgi:hypothetical protein
MVGCSKIFLLHIQKLNYEKGVYEQEDHVEKEVLSSNLQPTFKPIKKALTSFLNCLLKNV